MKHSITYVLLICLGIFLSACSNKPRIIPKDKLSQIYADLFMTDQWFTTYRGQMYAADTSRVYEPVFNKYGYNTYDYVASVEYYIQDPDRFARILRKTTIILEKEQERIKEAVKVHNARKLKAEAMRKYRPRTMYFLSPMDCPTTFSGMYVDSLGGRWNFTPYSIPQSLVILPENLDSIQK